MKSIQTQSDLNVFSLVAYADKLDTKTIYTVSPQWTQTECISLARMYAEKCVKLWYIIVSRTPFGMNASAPSFFFTHQRQQKGIENKRVFNFTYFITPAIQVLIHGVTYYDEDGHLIEIISPDSMLKQIPLSINIEQYLSDPKNIQKRTKLIGSVYANIRAALEDAVKTVSPALLKIENVKEMDEVVFRVHRRVVRSISLSSLDSCESANSDMPNGEE